MSISSALNNALSGLTASSRATQVVSSNIANAMTPGYGKRSIELASNATTGLGGVRITGITRHTDPVLLSDRRNAGSEVGFHTVTNRFLTDFEALIGTPNEPSSLSGRLSALNADLITAASRPDAVERLDSVVASAQELAGAIRTSSQGVQDARTRADANIAIEVQRLNDALSAVEDLNNRIVNAEVGGHDPSALVDERQALVDEISEMVPLRSMDRPNGAVALYSAQGAVLIDGRASEIGFEPTNVVTPYMSVADGSLSGLTINGIPQRTSSESGQLSGGTLGAHFAIRDELGVEAQAQLDAYARDLITRFEAESTDTTRAPGSPGLFTDEGGSFLASDEVGVAGRITLNAGVDPSQGGESWRLRDGLNATTPGDVGNSALLQSFSDALTTQIVPGSGNFGSDTMTSDGLLTTLAAQIGSDRMRSDQQLSFVSAQHAEFVQMELAQGVDTDAEMQQLLLIEQSYAANARMIQTIDEMMEALLRI
ncbi:MAG: flagellar hook-associated protein FlgK [Pseudomonadota bacterium]